MESTGCENVTIRFVVQTTQHPIFKNTHEVFVVGNIEELGNWNPNNGTKMQQVSLERFEASIIVPKNINNIIEYKYVNINGDGTCVNWEHGENRIIQKIDSQQFLQIQDQYRDALPRYSQLSKEIFTLDRILGRTPEQKITLDVPSSNDVVLVRFLVSAGTQNPKHYLAVSGNVAALGNWNSANAVVLTYTYPNWEVDVLVPRKDFPLEYKYQYKYHANLASGYEEGQNNRIDLRDFPTWCHKCVVQLNDVLRSRYFNYSRLTVNHHVLQTFLDECNSQGHHISDLIIVEDGKLVVNSSSALHVARQSDGKKVIKKIRNVSSYELYCGSQLDLELEALVDPECPFSELLLFPEKGLFSKQQFATLLKALKTNQSISSIFIGDNEPEEQPVKVMTSWLFEALAKNEYPRIENLIIDTVCGGKWNFAPFCRLVNSNTSIKKLDVACDSQTSFNMTSFLQALEANETLTSLKLRLQEIDVDGTDLVKALREKRKIQFIEITTPITGEISQKDMIGLAGVLQGLHFAADLPTELFENLIEELKRNKTLSSFVLFMYHSPGFCKDRLPVLMESLFETNWTLINLRVWDYRAQVMSKTMEFVKQQCDRNLKHQKQRHNNIIMAIFTIGRSEEALDLFPREVWLQIFSYIESSLGYNYCLMLSDTFKDSTMRKL